MKRTRRFMNGCALGATAALAAVTFWSAPASAQLPPLFEFTGQYLPPSDVPDTPGLRAQVASYDVAVNVPAPLLHDLAKSVLAKQTIGGSNQLDTPPRARFTRRMAWNQVRAGWIAIALAGCASQATETRSQGTVPAVAARRTISCEAAVDALLGASATHALVAGESPQGAGLLWVDLARGEVTRAYPTDPALRFARVISSDARGPQVDVVVEMQGADGMQVRAALAVDLEHQSIRLEAPPGGWSATALRGGVRLLAAQDRVYAATAGETQLQGEWVFNETRWMTWIGPVLVSVGENGQVRTWRAGSGRRSANLTLEHPARWRDEVVGYSAGDLIAWSPLASARVLVRDMGLTYGGLAAPVAASGAGLFLQTPAWVLWLDPGDASVRGRASLETPAPGLATSPRGVWVARLLRDCRGRASIRTMSSRRASSDVCVSQSELRHVDLADFAPAP